MLPPKQPGLDGPGLEPDGCHSSFQPELFDDSMMIPWVLVMNKRYAQTTA